MFSLWAARPLAVVPAPSSLLGSIHRCGPQARLAESSSRWRCLCRFRTIEAFHGRFCPHVYALFPPTSLLDELSHSLVPHSDISGHRGIVGTPSSTPALSYSC